MNPGVVSPPGASFHPLMAFSPDGLGAAAGSWEQKLPLFFFFNPSYCFEVLGSLSYLLIQNQRKKVE